MLGSRGPHGFCWGLLGPIFFLRASSSESFARVYLVPCFCSHMNLSNEVLKASSSRFSRPESFLGGPGAQKRHRNTSASKRLHPSPVAAWARKQYVRNTKWPRQLHWKQNNLPTSPSSPRRCSCGGCKSQCAMHCLPVHNPSVVVTGTEGARAVHGDSETVNE